jgi:hypothetical protein
MASVGGAVLLFCPQMRGGVLPRDVVPDISNRLGADAVLPGNGGALCPGFVLGGFRGGGRVRALQLVPVDLHRQVFCQNDSLPFKGRWDVEDGLLAGSVELHRRLLRFDAVWHFHGFGDDEKIERRGTLYIASKVTYFKTRKIKFR